MFSLRNYRNNALTCQVSTKLANPYCAQQALYQRMHFSHYFSFVPQSKLVFIWIDLDQYGFGNTNLKMTLNRQVTGKFYYYAVAYLPAFLASSMAVLIEKPHRRSSLAFYVANVASDALFRLWVARGILKPVPNGQVYLFSVAIATIMYLAKKNGFEDDALSTLIKIVIGSEEASKIRLGSKNRAHQSASASKDCSWQYELKGPDSKLIIESPRGDNKDVDKDLANSHENPIECWTNKQPTKSSYVNSMEINQPASEDANMCSSKQSALQSIRKFIFHSSHELCPHKHESSRYKSCFIYALGASARAFSIGYSVQLAMKLLGQLPNLRQNPQMALEVIRNPGPIKLATFLATFSGLYKALCCASRWHTNQWEPKQNFLAALLAGPALLLYPSPTISLYVLWKALEALLMESERTQKLSSQTKDSIIVLIYGLATSQLFYTALMNPRYMKKSYMAFLDRMSRHRLHLVNRSVLDVFGTQASAGYEDFFPDLHPKFMSDAFLGSIWIWMIEQKFPFTPIPQFVA